MKITELLTKKTILLDIEGNQKETAIDQLVGILYKAGKITNKAEFKAAILKREEQSTTGIGEGIAIPHAKVTAVKEAAMEILRESALDAPDHCLGTLRRGPGNGLNGDRYLLGGQALQLGELTDHRRSRGHRVLLHGSDIIVADRGALCLSLRNMLLHST